MASRMVFSVILALTVIIQHTNCKCPPPSNDLPANGISPNTYPNPKRDDSSQDTYGCKVVIKDPYRWMEAVNCTETKKFIEEEMKITKPYLEKAPFRAELTARYKELYTYGSITRIAQHGNKFYSYESNGSTSQKQDVVYIHDSPNDEGKVFMDPNPTSQNNTIFLDDADCAGIDHGFSPDGSILAYSMTDINTDFRTVKFKHVEKGDIYPHESIKIKDSWIVWSKDGKGIFYSAYPDQKCEKDKSGKIIYRYHTLYYHFLGTEQAKDIVVVEFPNNPDYIVSCWGSQTGNYLIVSVSEKKRVKNLIYIADLNKVNCEIKGKLDLIPVVTKIEYSYQYVTNTDTVFVFRTTQGADNYKLISIDIKNPNKQVWKDLVSASPNKNYVLEFARAAYEKYMILAYTQDVKTVLQVNEISTGKFVKNIPIDVGIVEDNGFSCDIKYKDIYFRIVSLLSPSMIYHCDLSNPSFPLEVIKEVKLKNFDREKYTAEQIFIKSKDGTNVPTFVAYKKGLQKNGNNPVYMIGDGAFGNTRTYFTTNRIVFIDNLDSMHVIPCIRGGGEYDDQWYRNGSLDKKQNTFDDFQAVAEFLIKEKYTNSKLLSVFGAIGGGLLMGVCINQRPDLFGAVIADAGLYDMLRFDKLNTDKDNTLVNEFGSPSKPEDFAYLIKYSPLHNIKMSTDKQYPPTMLTAYDYDDVISPAHSFKFIAELQFQAKSHPNQQNPLIIRVTKNDATSCKDVRVNNYIADLVDEASFIAFNTGIKFHN